MENDKIFSDSGLSESLNISNSESEGLSADHELDNTYNSKVKMQSMRSHDSGYESDKNIIDDSKIIERVNSLTDTLRKDLEGIEGFVIQEFIKLSQQHGGIIDISHQDFINAKKSLIESDPDAPGNKGKAVLSVTATTKGIEEKIKKTVSKENISEDYFADFIKETKDFKKELEQKLSSNDSIESLINRRLVTQLFDPVMLMDIGSDGKPTLMSSNNKKEFFAKITPYVNDLPAELKHIILLEPKKIERLKGIINKETLKYFAIDGDSKIWGTLDDKKITEETIKQFADSINQILEDENKNLISEGILQEAIKKLSIEKRLKVTDKQSKEILEQLSPSLSKLSVEQLKDKKDNIILDVAKKPWYSNGLPISKNNLQNIAISIAENYQSIETNNQVNTPINLPESRSIAQERIENFQKLPRRLDEYRQGADKISTSLYDKAIIYNQAMHSILELGAENFANSLSDQKTEALLKKLNSNTQYVNNFITTETEKNKTNFYMADTEAKLKGFNFSKMMEKYPRDKEERDLAERITKQAMLELQGKHIPKDQYSSKILEKIEQIQEYKNKIGLGDQAQHITKELAKLTENEKTEVSKVVEEVADSFIKTLDNNNRIQSNTHSLTIANKTIQGLFTEKKLLIQPNEEDKIKNKLVSALSAFDPEYLDKNTENISKVLVEDITKNGNVSWWKKNFTISDGNLGEIVNNIKNQEFTTSSIEEKPDLSNKILTSNPESRVSAISATSTRIVNDAIKLVHTNTGKIFNWGERYKIQERLVNELSTLGDEYLKNNNSKLTEDIAQSLKTNAKSRWFSSKLTINPDKLEIIVGKIRVIASENDKFNKEKSLIFADANLDRTTLAVNLSKFLNENNIDANKIFKQPGIVGDDKQIKAEGLKLITSQQFIELRKIAPESFDKIMFSKPKNVEVSLPPNISNLKRRETSKSITSSM